MNNATASIRWVITAIYAGTFANAVRQILTFDDASVRIRTRDSTTVAIVFCASICMIMALRFFFGNNNFIDFAFSKPHPAGVRLYHFSTIATQSLILLGNSYVIRNPPIFVKWLLILFLVELIWYAGSLLFARSDVQTNGSLNWPLFMNECANAILVSGAAGALKWLRNDPNVLVYLVTGFFVANTAIDLKVNLKWYMGDSPGIVPGDNAP